MNKDIKKWLKQNDLKDYDHAESMNHHSLCALIESEQYLNHEERSVRHTAIGLFNVAYDLCSNDYDGIKFSEYTRQVLIAKRQDLSSRLYDELHPRYTMDDVPF